MKKLIAIATAFFLTVSATAGLAASRSGDPGGAEYRRNRQNHPDMRQNGPGAHNPGYRQDKGAGQRHLSMQQRGQKPPRNQYPPAQGTPQRPQADRNQPGRQQGIPGMQQQQGKPGMQQQGQQRENTQNQQQSGPGQGPDVWGKDITPNRPGIADM